MYRYVKRFYGAKPDAPDPRDRKKVYRYHQIPAAGTVDLRKYVDHVYDQGKLGSSTANAVCAAYRLHLTKQAQIIRGGFDFDPSRLFVYYITRQYARSIWEDTGTSIRDTVKALNRKGVCEEIYWPYEASNFKKRPSQDCYDQAKDHNFFCEYERLNQDIDQFRACLHYCGDMPMPSREEVLFNPVGMHMVMAVGYDDATQRMTVLNSWGTGWGNKGYFYMPYDFIKDSNLCFDFWKISFACERGKPRPKGAATTSAGGSGYSSGGYSGYRPSSSSSSGACGYGGGAWSQGYSRQW